MAKYDIKIAEPRDRVSERKRDTRARKVDWTQAMREAAEAERLVQSTD